MALNTNTRDEYTTQLCTIPCMSTLDPRFMHGRSVRGVVYCKDKKTLQRQTKTMTVTKTKDQT